jgi:hypothetical protein
MADDQEREYDKNKTRVCRAAVRRQGHDPHYHFDAREQAYQLGGGSAPRRL